MKIMVFIKHENIIFTVPTNKRFIEPNEALEILIFRCLFKLKVINFLIMYTPVYSAEKVIRLLIMVNNFFIFYKNHLSVIDIIRNFFI